MMTTEVETKSEEDECDTWTTGSFLDELETTSTVTGHFRVDDLEELARLLHLVGELTWKWKMRRC